MFHNIVGAGVDRELGGVEPPLNFQPPLFNFFDPLAFYIINPRGSIMPPVLFLDTSRFFAINVLFYVKI